MDYDTARFLAQMLGECIVIPEPVSLRDQFAMAALTGLLANSYSDGHSQPMCTAPSEEFARWAYSQADAMIEARKQPSL